MFNTWADDSMSRQASPALPPGSQYPEPAAAHPLSAPTTYYDPIDERPLMTDEMMEDIQRINQNPGNASHQGISEIEAQPSSPPDQARPVTPQRSQAPLSATAQASQQPYTPDGPSSEGYTDGNKRKRSKVSRACDECRRKKVKDA